MTHPTSLEWKWNDKKLTVDDIIPKIAEYATWRGIDLTRDEIESISRQIYRAYKKFHDPSEYVGEFMLALAGDSFREVCNICDNINEKALIIYHYYFYNCVPGDWRKKLLRTG